MRAFAKNIFPPNWIELELELITVESWCRRANRPQEEQQTQAKKKQTNKNRRRTLSSRRVMGHDIWSANMPSGTIYSDGLRTTFLFYCFFFVQFFVVVVAFLLQTSRTIFNGNQVAAVGYVHRGRLFSCIADKQLFTFFIQFIELEWYHIAFRPPYSGYLWTAHTEH